MKEKLYKVFCWVRDHIHFLFEVLIRLHIGGNDIKKDTQDVRDSNEENLGKKD